MSLILFAWDTHWVNLIGFSPGIDAHTRGGSLCCCTCVVWRSVCFSDYKNPSMSFHYKNHSTHNGMCLSPQLRVVTQPRDSFKCSPDIWDPSPSSTPNSTALHFKISFFAWQLLLCDVNVQLWKVYLYLEKTPTLWWSSPNASRELCWPVVNYLTVNMDTQKYTWRQEQRSLLPGPRGGCQCNRRASCSWWLSQEGLSQLLSDIPPSPLLPIFHKFYNF